VPRDFDFRFSTWISFPQAEIFTAEGAPLVALTPVANGKNLQSEIFIISFGHLLDTVSIKINFFFKFILSCQQFDNCSHCLSPVSTTLAKLAEKFASDFVDSGGAP
jgi:hypothetical protein